MAKEELPWWETEWQRISWTEVNWSKVKPDTPVFIIIDQFHVGYIIRKGTFKSYCTHCYGYDTPHIYYTYDGGSYKSSIHGATIDQKHALQEAIKRNDTLVTNRLREATYYNDSSIKLREELKCLSHTLKMTISTTITKIQ